MTTKRISFFVIAFGAAACSAEPRKEVVREDHAALVSAPSRFVDACELPGHVEPTLLPYDSIWAGDEGASAPIPLPFPFQLFGRTHSRFWVTSNGELGFGDTPRGADFGRTSCPLADPNISAPIVFVYATDLLSSKICVATTGTAPRRSVVVTWRDGRLYEVDGTGNGTSDLRFGVTLSEASSIDVAIDRVEVWTPFWPSTALVLGAWATVGLQHATRAVDFSCQSLLAPPGARFHVP